MESKTGTAELRLRKLAIDLKKAYSKAGRHIASTLTPFEVAVADIGETWKPAHYAEMARNRGVPAAVRPVTCFAHETFVNGDEADYVLCVGRKPDMKCSLFVSICKYRIGQGQGDGTGEDKEGEVTIRAATLVPVVSLPVPLRMKVIDVLDDFAAEYDEHVRHVRDEILVHWAGSGKEDDAEEDEPAADAEGERGRVRLFSPDREGVPPEKWVPNAVGAK